MKTDHPQQTNPFETPSPEEGLSISSRDLYRWRIGKLALTLIVLIHFVESLILTGIVCSVLLLLSALRVQVFFALAIVFQGSSSYEHILDNIAGNHSFRGLLYSSLNIILFVALLQATPPLW